MVMDKQRHGWIDATSNKEITGSINEEVIFSEYTM